jgi:threonine aldolase
LAEALAELPGVELDPGEVVTNIVIFRVTGAAEPAAMTPALTMVEKARQAGVLGVPVGADRVRFVTHKDAPAAAVEQAIARLRATFLA